MKGNYSKTVFAALALGMVVSAKAAPQTWTNSDGINPLVWDTTSTNWTGAAWVNGNTPTFGSTGVGTITVASGITATGTSQINASGYVFNGTGPSLGSLTLASGINSEFNTASLGIGSNGTLTVNGGTLTVRNGGTLGGAVNGFINGGASGGVINVESGVFNFANGAAISNGGVGTSVIMNFNGTSTFTSAGTTQFALGFNTNASGTLNYNSSGTSTFGSGHVIAIARNGNGTLVQTAGTINVTNNSSFAVQVGNAGTGLTGTLDLQGGSFVLNGGTAAVLSVNQNKTGAGILHVRGGSVSAPTIALASATGGSSQVILDSGTINADAITTPNGGSKSIELNGGAIGTYNNTTAAWAANMTLGGNTAFRATNATGTSATITVSGVLSGSGGLTKTGAGTLLLTGANNYAGNTVVSVGAISTGATGSFGTGNLTLASATTLTLGNNASIADTANLLFDAVTIINLNGGTETLAQLLNTTTNTYMSIGTWTASQLNNMLGVSSFAGTGSLNVTAVPEPSTWTLLAAGMGMLAILRRRTKK